LPIEENLVQIRGEVKAYQRARHAALHPSTPLPNQLTETAAETKALRKRSPKEEKKPPARSIPDYKGPLLTIGHFTNDWVTLGIFLFFVLSFVRMSDCYWWHREFRREV
jgi:hypothetical protein